MDNTLLSKLELREEGEEGYAWVEQPAEHVVSDVQRRTREKAAAASLIRVDNLGVIVGMIKAKDHTEGLDTLQKARFAELAPFLQAQSAREIKEASDRLFVLERLEICERRVDFDGVSPEEEKSEVERRKHEGAMSPGVIEKEIGRFRRERRLDFLQQVGACGYGGDYGINALRRLANDEIKQVLEQYSEAMALKVTESRIKASDLTALLKSLKTLEQAKLALKAKRAEGEKDDNSKDLADVLEILIEKKRFDKQLKQADGLRKEREKLLLAPDLSPVERLKETMLVLLERELLARQADDTLREKTQKLIEILSDRSNKHWREYLQTSSKFEAELDQSGLVGEFLRTSSPPDWYGRDEQWQEENAKKILIKALSQQQNPRLNKDRFNDMLRFHDRLFFDWLRERFLQLLSQALVDRENPEKMKKSGAGGPRLGAEYRGEGRV